MCKRFFLFTIAALFVTLGVAQASQNEHLSRAKELYRLGRWSDARLELLEAKNYVERYNYIDNQEIDFYLALCSVGLEERSAIETLDYFESQHPGSIYTNQVDFNRGLIFCAAEEYEEAKAELSKVDYEKLNSAEREKYDIRMGYIAFMEGDYTAANKYLSRISEDSEYWDHALYYKSYMSYAQGDLNSAKEGFTQLTLSDSYGALAPYYLLQIEFQQENFSYVISEGDELLNNVTPSQRGDIARTMAEACFRVEDFEQAIKYITIYQSGGEEMSRADNYILGFSLYRITRYTAAQEYLKLACGADDELTQNASYHLADCYIRSGNKTGAMQAFAMASSNNFNAEIAEDALFNYGKLQYELGGGRFNEAINVLTRYVATYPNSERTPEAKVLLVAALYNSRDYNAAYKAIKEIVNPDSDIKSALQKITYFKALEAMNSGDNSTAKSNFKESEAVGISAKYTALSKFWQGEISYLEGDYDAAMKDFNSYISRAPKGDQTYVLAQYSTAYALLKKENEAAALTYFERFIKMSPMASELRMDAYNRVGDILYGERKFADASTNYKVAAGSSMEGSYYANYQLAMVEGIMGDTQSKLSRLKAIVAKNKGEYVDDAAHELGRTYMAQEKYGDAKQSLEEFVANYPDSPMYAQALSDLGLAYLNLGDKVTSISYYNKAIEYAPQTAVSKDALQGIREIYVNQGDVNGYFAYAEKLGVDSDLNTVAKDSLSFASAQRQYISGGDTKRAATLLASYITDYPQGYYLNDALFLLSDCHLKNGDNKSAITSLTQLSERGTNQYSQRVLERLSRLTYEQGDYTKSAAAYRKLYDITKSDSDKAAAMEGYASATIATKDRSMILKMSNDVLSQPKSGDKAIVKAKYSKATILRENGEWAEAVKLYADLSKDPLSAVGAESTYYIISNAHRGGDIDRAEDMIFDFSESQTTQGYWLAKSFIMLGDIYTAKGDAFQARATYQSIVDGYATKDDGVIEEAKSKIEKLK
ncbi:MAG: tetratricopeptide repeat protein [Rikenellaceae bacterium]